jgi:ATP phosphoribosyltransferase regulatory subunit
VFEAYAPGVSEPVAVGGRYDALGARFGTDRASVGFAIRIDMLHRALVPQARNGTPRQGVVVADGFGAEAATARSLRGAGLAAVVVGADADAERLAEEDDWRYVVRREGPGFAVLDRRTGERFSCGRPEEVLPSRA